MGGERICELSSANVKLGRPVTYLMNHLRGNGHECKTRR